MRAANFSWNVAMAAAIVACCSVFTGVKVSSAQLLYSFETPNADGWTILGVPAPTSTTLGVTDGSKSMLIDNMLSGFHNDEGLRTTGSGNDYGIWNDAALAIAAGNTNVKLEFDFSWDHTSMTSAGFAQLGIFVNSTGANFREYGTGALIGGNINGVEPDIFPRLAAPAIADGVTLTTLGPNSIHLAIPMNTAATSDGQGLNIGSGSGNFYQMGFKTNGGWGGTVDWAIDNVQITGVQVPTTSETLFSWETADNPGTPAVDERFEGWQEGGVGANPPHHHSIVTTGATQGTHALQLDRTATAPTGFTWGSSYILNSVVNPGPTQTIDPAIQSKIESLIGKISAADRVAFDVTYQYQDLFPLPNPTFTGFGVHFADETGHQFQAFGDNINVAAATSPTTTTVEIPFSEFVDSANNTLTLLNTGLLANSHYLRIAISSSTDGAQIYQIDNFRLLTEVSQGVPGDYNSNGVVDGADYVVWRKHLGQTFQLPNEVTGTSVGTVTPEDYAAWRVRFGNTSGAGSLAGNQAVPEPSSVALVLVAAMGLVLTRRNAYRTNLQLH